MKFHEVFTAIYNNANKAAMYIFIPENPEHEEYQGSLMDWLGVTYTIASIEDYGTVVSDDFVKYKLNFANTIKIMSGDLFGKIDKRKFYGVWLFLTRPEVEKNEGMHLGYWSPECCEWQGQPKHWPRGEWVKLENSPFDGDRKKGTFCLPFNYLNVFLGKEEPILTEVEYVNHLVEKLKKMGK